MGYPISPVLAYPDFAKPLVISTDASNKAIGDIHEHEDIDGREHPIMYASRSLSNNEQNYSTWERKALAVVFAPKKFHPYLLCKPYELFIDYQA